MRHVCNEVAERWAASMSALAIVDVTIFTRFGPSTTSASAETGV